MPHILVGEAQAWLNDNKLDLGASFTTDQTELEDQISTQVLSRLDSRFDVSTWTDNSNTPALVRTIIAMLFVAWYYDQVYSDDEEANAYAALLRQYAEANIEAILNGSQVLVEVDPDTTADLGLPAFFPNDLSSSQEPTTENPSDGGPSFLMGQVF